MKLSTTGFTTAQVAERAGIDMIDAERRLDLAVMGGRMARIESGPVVLYHRRRDVEDEEKT